MTIDTSLDVLIVDDYKTMLRIIRNLLKQIGFENVDEAADGTEALGKLRTKRYGLVISDWNMSPMTGLELLQAVRADAKLATIPFIMITAESKTENVVAAKQAGVSNYIVKPFNAETLQGKIEKVLGHGLRQPPPLRMPRSTSRRWRKSSPPSAPRTRPCARRWWPTWCAR